MRTAHEVRQNLNKDIQHLTPRAYGIIQKEESQGVISSSVNNRVAFDVFTCSDPERVARGERVKIDKHTANIAHSGDKLDAAAGRDAPRFHHECTASTFMTPTHVAYMVHACSAAVARATAKAARQYAHARAISHSVRENTLTRPAVVQPTF